MTKSTQQLADEIARKCAEHCVGLNLYPEQTASLVLAKGIQKKIPLLELLEIARAVKNTNFKLSAEIEMALTNLQKKVEL